jgi:hypothetical protein
MTATATLRSRSGNGKAATEILSIKQISERCGLDRATAKKRLDLHKYEPVNSEAKLKQYSFDAEMEARLTEISDQLGQVRIRKETAAARKIEMQLAEAEGSLVSVEEFTDVIQKVFGSMHKQIAVRMPKRLAARLAKAKTAPEVQKILTHDLSGIFSLLKSNWEDYLTGK